MTIKPHGTSALDGHQTTKLGSSRGQPSLANTCMQNARFFAFPLIVLSVFSLAVMGSKQSTSKPITKEEADAAIKAWMGAFVGLSDADSAEAFITKFYAYGSVETMLSRRPRRRRRRRPTRWHTSRSKAR